MSEFTQEEINRARPKPFTVEIVTIDKRELDSLRERISQLEEENKRFGATILDVTAKAILLKQHADAMADDLRALGNIGYKYDSLSAYRADFPEEGE